MDIIKVVNDVFLAFLNRGDALKFSLAKLLPYGCRRHDTIHAQDAYQEYPQIRTIP